MEFTCKQLAELLNGVIEGDPDVRINKLSKIEEGEPQSVSFLANEQYTSYIYDTNASVIIVNKTFQPERALQNGCTLIRVNDARMAFSKLLKAYSELKNKREGKEEPVFIGESAVIGKGYYIGAFVYIGKNSRIGDNVKLFPGVHIDENVSIGDNTTLHAGVKVYADCKIGAGCTLHSGAIIGSDGFGFAPNKQNNYQKVVHTGNVVIEDHVEIGANCTIDKATLGSTIVRKGVKLDNLIQIAHNVEIGENTVIAAQTGIAGSTKIGKNCMIGGQVGIVGHITIADEVKIAAQSGIGHSIEEPGTIVQGSPAFAIGDYKRAYVLFRNLPKMKEKIEALEKSIPNFRGKISSSND